MALTKGVIALNDYIANLRDIRKMMEGGALGGGQVGINPWASERGDYIAKKTFAGTQFKEFEHLGSYDNGVKSLNKDVLPDAPITGHFSDDDRAKVDASLKIAERSFNNLVRTYGGPDVSGQMGAPPAPGNGLMLGPPQ
jgi:hypothetical protein